MPIMKNNHLWLFVLITSLALFVGSWGLGVWITGCASTMQEEAETTTMVTTSTSSSLSTSTSATTGSTGSSTTPITISSSTTTTTITVAAWTEQTPSAAFSSREGHTSLFYNSKMWVIAGAGGFFPNNDVWYSQNGADWSLATAEAAFVGRKHHASVVFNDKLWVIGGAYVESASYYKDRNDVWYSNDGASWVLATAEAGFSGRSGHSVVAFNNKMFLIGGASFESGGFVDRLNDVWSSPDGISWTQEVSSAPFSTRAAHTCVVYNNKIWVIGGFNGFSFLNDVWYSSDGSNWINATNSAAFSGRGGHASVIFHNKLWVIGGDAGSTPFQNDAWSSNDGVIWTREAYTGFLGRRYHSSVASNEIRVIGGYTDSDKNDVWRYP
jgi:N-acetylneuraminic acid mutarotase